MPDISPEAQSSVLLEPSLPNVLARIAVLEQDEVSNSETCHDAVAAA